MQASEVMNGRRQEIYKLTGYDQQGNSLQGTASSGQSKCTGNINALRKMIKKKV